MLYQVWNSLHAQWRTNKMDKCYMPVSNSSYPIQICLISFQNPEILYKNENFLTIFQWILAPILTFLFWSKYNLN